MKLVVYRGSGRWGRLLHAVRGGKQTAVITAVRRGNRNHLVELDWMCARVDGSVGLLRVEMHGTVL
jgi:ADP-dependent phosphofructokinase/glucokinase